MCFPEMQDPKERPFKFAKSKRIVFFSARVHPGETPSSFVLNGILDFLISGWKQAKKLLSNFVFKIVPLVNPDGVSRGYYRLDTFGQNLNRFYLDPTTAKQPTIFGIHACLKQLSSYDQLDYYIDLHAHPIKRGCFLFGNMLPEENYVDNLMFGKLISMNTLNFDYAECNFSRINPWKEDEKDRLKRDGSGRVGIYHLTKVPHCYTLECNYASGWKGKRLPPKVILETGKMEPDPPINDFKKILLNENGKPVYNTEVFEDVGRAVVISLLDMIGENPISRLPKSIYKDIEQMRLDIQIQNNVNVLEARRLKQELIKSRA